MILGIDFDNTIAGYDELMHELGMESGFIDADVPKSKRIIRDEIRKLPDGELLWRGLQVKAYGSRMLEASIFPGAKEFFLFSRHQGIPIFIISHKTEYPNFGDEKVNLREQAMRWLEAQGFFDEAGIALDRSCVYFESTRDEKIRRIRDLKVTHVIDDLEEVFHEPCFPSSVYRILFAPQSASSNTLGLRSFPSWAAIQAHLFGPSSVMTFH